MKHAEQSGASSSSAQRRIGSWSLIALWIVSVVATPAPPRAAAQCSEWVTGPLTTFSSLAWPVNDMISFDLDGGGPMPAQLIAATTDGVWRWDGYNWRMVGQPIYNAKAFSVWNGSLVVAGLVNDSTQPHARSVFQWSGGNGWILLGTVQLDSPMGGVIHATAAYNGKLIIGGSFESVNSVEAKCVAQWNGTAWQTAGYINSTGPRAMTVFDLDGAGPDPASLVIATGVFSNDFGQGYGLAASWDGSVWNWDLSNGTTTCVASDLCVANGTLYVCGRDYSGKGAVMERLNGNSWFTVLEDDDEDAEMTSMTAWTSAVAIGGKFSIPGFNSDNIILWNGFQAFEMAPGWPCPVVCPPDNGVRAVCVHNGSLMAAERLTAVGQSLGFGWTPLDIGTGYATATMGSRVVIGGNFSKYVNGTSGALAYNLAAWNGQNLINISAGTNGTVRALKSYLNGFENVLIVGGEFTQVGTEGGVIGIAGGSNAANRIARWTDAQIIGGGWEAMGDGFNGNVLAVEWLAANQFFSDVIFAAGEFTAAGSGSPSFNRVASWSGSPGQWFTMGTGFNGTVRAIKGINSGPINRTVVAGGDFTTASGVASNRIASYSIPNLNGWVAMGNGFNAPVHAVERHNGSWYAGGEFTLSGSVTVNRIARWSGTAWVPVGNTQGFNGTVRALMSNGGFLYAAGDFTSADGNVALGVARYNGSGWESDGLAANDDPVNALGVFHNEIHAPGASAAMSLRRLADVPWISQHPVSQELPCNEVAEFVCTAPGYTSAARTWRKDGVALVNGLTKNGSVISGAADSTLYIIGSVVADSGMYDCIVSNACGSITSNAASLEVTEICCPADITGNGVVDVDDLLEVVNGWGFCFTFGCPADIVPAGGNQFIDVDDLLRVINEWGMCPS